MIIVKFVNLNWAHAQFGQTLHIKLFFKTISTNETQGLSKYRYILATVTYTLWLLYALLMGYFSFKLFRWVVHMQSVDQLQVLQEGVAIALKRVGCVDDQ